MYRTLLGTAVMAGALAFAQLPAHPGGVPRTGVRHRSMPAAADKKFASDAAIGGMLEVQLGQMANEKSTNADVKEFGQRMVTDHSKALDELKVAAATEHIDLPTSLDAKHQALVDRFSRLSGSEFDHAYVRAMVKDHDADVKEFQRAAQSAQSTAIRDYAAKTLPTLQDHQKSIHEIDRKMMAK